MIGDFFKARDYSLKQPKSVCHLRYSCRWSISTLRSVQVEHTHTQRRAKETISISVHLKLGCCGSAHPHAVAHAANLYLSPLGAFSFRNLRIDWFIITVAQFLNTVHATT